MVVHTTGTSHIHFLIAIGEKVKRLKEDYILKSIFFHKSSDACAFHSCTNFPFSCF